MNLKHDVEVESINVEIGVGESTPILMIPSWNEFGLSLGKYERFLRLE